VDELEAAAAELSQLTGFIGPVKPAFDHQAVIDLLPPEHEFNSLCMQQLA
jgi:hypothetical protein